MPSSLTSWLLGLPRGHQLLREVYEDRSANLSTSSVLMLGWFSHRLEKLLQVSDGSVALFKKVGLFLANRNVGSTNTDDVLPLPPTDAQLMQSSVVSNRSPLGIEGPTLVQAGTRVHNTSHPCCSAKKYTTHSDFSS
jgi:hypothetical protein